MVAKALSSVLSLDCSINTLIALLILPPMSSQNLLLFARRMIFSLTLTCWKVRSFPESRTVLRAVLPDRPRKPETDSAFSDVHIKQQACLIVNYKACKNLIAAFESGKITVEDLMLLEMTIHEAKDRVGHGNHSNWNHIG
jgi:hypothetical protein